MHRKRGQHRVRAYSVNRSSYGYEGTHEVFMQKLQRHNGLWWVTLAREEVPNHAYYSQRFYGDTGGWKSAFAAYF